jgi:hypothetical protein
MGAAAAMSTATTVLSDLASAAVSAVQGLVVAAAAASSPPLRFESSQPPLEEILEVDESRALSPSVPDSAPQLALYGSAMGSAVAGGTAVSGALAGAGAPATDMSDGRWDDPSTQHQPRYPTYSSLPISVISDDLDLSTPLSQQQQQHYYHHHAPSSLTNASQAAAMPGMTVMEASFSDPSYRGMVASPGGALPPDVSSIPPPPVVIGGVPIVTDLSLSTVLNQNEMIDVPVSPLAMMGFQMEIQDLDDYGDSDPDSEASPGGGGGGRGRGGASRM